jgi:hypothetical protein
MTAVRKIKVRRSFRGAGLLPLLVAVACSHGPTAPSDSRTQMSSASHATNPIGSATAEHACAFGAGYWKAHTDAWPSRFSPTAAFYSSGKSWIDVLRAPSKGDVYYILGRQFIAAALNLHRLDPAIRPSEIGEPFAIAERDYFTAGAHTPLTRTEVVRLATVLERFNDGNAGVPACQ